MVLLNNLLFASINFSPGLQRPDGIKFAEGDSGVATDEPVTPATHVVRDVGLANHVTLADNPMDKRDEMIEVPESDLEDLLDEIKNLEGQVEAMMPNSKEDEDTEGSDSEGNDCDASDPLAPREADCSPAPIAAAHKMIELSNSVTSDDSEDSIDGDSTPTSPALAETPTTTSPETQAVTPTETTSSVTSTPWDETSIGRLGPLPSDVTIATADVLHMSPPTAGAVAFTDKYETVVVTSTRKSTQTITQTRTKVISLAQAPEATDDSAPPMDDETVVDDVDTQQKNTETEDTETEEEPAQEEPAQDGEEPSVAPSANAPPRVGFVQQFSNTTAKKFTPAVKPAPLPKLPLPTPAPELPALSGFKTITTPGLEDSGKTMD